MWVTRNFPSFTLFEKKKENRHITFVYFISCSTNHLPLSLYFTLSTVQNVFSCFLFIRMSKLGRAYVDVDVRCAGE